MEELKPIIGTVQSYTTEEGKTVRLRCLKYSWCTDCFFADKVCHSINCIDKGNDTMYVEEKTYIKNDIETLERIAKEYKGRTIENIIENLKQRQREAEK